MAGTSRIAYTSIQFDRADRAMADVIDALKEMGLPEWVTEAEEITQQLESMKDSFNLCFKDKP